MGGGSRKKQPKAYDVQSQLAQQLFAETDPLRRGMIGRSDAFLSGEDVMDSPQFANLKVQTGRSFNQAKDNAIARFAPGGALIDAITGLESDRASTLSAGAAGLQEDELGRAMSLGTGLAGASLGALGQAGNTQAMMAQANAQVKAAEKGAIGEIGGAIAGGGK
jgi:hypothetical protein